jgi:glycerophosphoryl diester phosphodiesterase
VANGKAQRLIERSRQSALPLIIAHRGCAGRFPENTFSAFRAGLVSGAEVVELDYRHSSDGVPVVIHDATLERTTNAASIWGEERLAVSERTAAELASLDAAGKERQSGEPEPLPTLEQVLKLVQASRITMIERKAGDAATLHRLLTRFHWEHDVVVQAFDWDFLRELRTLSPNMVLGALCKEPLTPELVAEAAAIPVQIITWNHELLDRAGIECIHAAGKLAWTYTVNEIERAQQLWEAGIDGVISNFPHEMVAWRDRLPRNRA